MAQLGYTWYPKDWFTSTTRKRLKRFPLVRYAMRELFDLMYMDGAPIEMNKEYLLDDLDIDLNEDEYKKLLEYISINHEGKWWINSIKKRISKAEAARENGKKGGRPKTQKPTEKTQTENPNNPPLERESKREREKESKKEIKSKNNIEDRKLKFASTLNPFLEKYAKDLLNQFYAYWTEPNKSNSKFRQELEKTWSLKRRLETWSKNDKNFKQPNQQKTDVDKFYSRIPTV